MLTITIVGNNKDLTLTGFVTNADDVEFVWEGDHVHEILWEMLKDLQESQAKVFLENDYAGVFSAHCGWY